MITTRANAKQAAARLARTWLEHDPVILDTETTGLDSLAQICDMALIGADGKVLLNTLVKPTHSIPLAIAKLHNINDQAVKDAPSFVEVWSHLQPLIAEKHIIIYNAPFDRRMLLQSAAAHLMKLNDRNSAGLHCAMQLYAQWRGDLKSNGRGWRWHRLELAADQCSIAPTGQLHRAHTDAEICRQIVLKMAQAT